MRLRHRDIGVIAVLTFLVLLAWAPLHARAQTGDTGWVYDDHGCAFYQANGVFTGQIGCPRVASEGWAPGCYQFLDGPHYWDGATLSGLGCPDPGTATPAPEPDQSPGEENESAGMTGNKQAGNDTSPQSQSQSQSANGCGPGKAGPHYACPAESQPGYTYIEHVQATPRGVSILLTPDGIELGNQCGGPAKLVDMAYTLYQAIPANQRASSDIDWEGRQLEDEFYAHAYFATFPDDTTVLGINFAGSGNPIDIDFADYTHLLGRNRGDIGQQLAFSYLGDAHRLRCSQ